MSNKETPIPRGMPEEDGCEPFTGELPKKDVGGWLENWLENWEKAIGAVVRFDGDLFKYRIISRAIVDGEEGPKAYVGAVSITEKGIEYGVSSDKHDAHVYYGDTVQHAIRLAELLDNLGPLESFSVEGPSIA